MTDSSQIGRRNQWLQNGGWIVASSERAARFVRAGFDAARVAEGVEAWAAPVVLSWSAFVRKVWDELPVADARLILADEQETELWSEILAQSKTLATLLPGPRRRMAQMAQQAYQLICTHAPEALHQAARENWQGDAAEMSRWLTAFEKRQTEGLLLSGQRAAYESRLILEQAKSTSVHEPVLLVGFDRIQPTQLALLDAWGVWQQEKLDSQDVLVQYVVAVDSSEEIAACVLWCARELEQNPATQLIVIANDIQQRRGEIERAFTRWLPEKFARAFEFSLGVPLATLPIAKTALQLLGWLSKPSTEHLLDWLLSTGRVSTNEQENAALQKLMRALRRRQSEQAEWGLEEFVSVAELQVSRALPEQLERLLPLENWARRMRAAMAEFAAYSERTLTPLEWAEFLPKLLDSLGWPGYASLESAEYQAREQFLELIESLATLGFNGRKISWQDALSVLEQRAAEALFAPESRNASILISGAVETAGLTADGIWLLGAEEGKWPQTGTTNPLLPLTLQRNAAMPHASAEVDWQLARTITARLTQSASSVYFSCARVRDEEETKPSRLVELIAGVPVALPESLCIPAAPRVELEEIAEERRIPFPHAMEKGGAKVLTLQSNCPFKAFAQMRLDATSWNAGEYGLTALERGQLLHKTMATIWGGEAKRGISTLAELKALVCVENDDRLNAFVDQHIERAIASEIKPERRVHLQRMHIKLESQRLLRWVADWLRYESAREEFEVLAIEEGHTVEVTGLTLDLRVDRIDRVLGSSLLIIDYKTGDVKPKLWELPRLEDVQLPLYACFAAEELPVAKGSEVEGLAFAKIRPQERLLVGKFRNPDQSFRAGLSGATALMKDRLDENLLHDWSDELMRLAYEYLQGVADVDPRDAEKTCDACYLQVLCRIREAAPRLSDTDEDEEGGDE